MCSYWRGWLKGERKNDDRQTQSDWIGKRCGLKLNQKIFRVIVSSVQKKFCDPVVLESICYRTRTYRLINESITTLGLRKIWTGWPKNHALVWKMPCRLLQYRWASHSLERGHNREKHMSKFISAIQSCSQYNKKYVSFLNMIKLNISETFIEINFDWNFLDHVPKWDWLFLSISKWNLRDSNASQSFWKVIFWNQHIYKHNN